MSRPRIARSLALASFGVLLFGACSAESLTERATSFGLEQAIEGDEDIDLDFGGDGGFSISTDEGDFSVNFDEENGSINFNTDDGDGVISFDQDNGSINFNTDDGDGTLQFDDDGGLTIQTDEGEVGVFNSQDVPSSWPQVLTAPISLVPGSQNFSVLDLGDTVVTTGVFNHDSNEPYAATTVSKLLDSGWTQGISSDQDGTVFAQLTGPDGSVAQIVGDETGSTTISLTVMK